MTNGVSSVLAVIQKDVLGLKKAIDLTTGGFTRMKVAVAGVAFVGFGSGILYGMSALSKAGEKWEHQLVQIKNAGFSVEEQTLAIAAANRTASQVMTTTPTENLKAIGELRYALAGSIKGGTKESQRLRATEEAARILPAVQKAQAVINSTLGSEKHGGDVYEMVKALELMGATQDENRFNKLLEGMVRASIAQQGRLNASDWFSTIKYTRGMGRGLEDDFIMNVLPTLMQELKTGKGSGQGGGAGNPLAALDQIVIGGHGMSIAGAKEANRLGMIKPGGLKTTTTGKISGIKPFGWRGSEVEQVSPYRFVLDSILKPMVQHGITDPQKQRAEISVIFTNRVAQQIIGLMSMAQKIEADRIQIEGTERLEPAYQRAAREDPKIVRDELGKQWDRVTTDLGKPLTKLRVKFFYELARGLSMLADVIENHPGMAVFIIKLIGAIGVMFVVIGGLAIAAAAISALGGLGVVAVGTAIIAFSAAIAYVLRLVNWDDVSKWALGIRQWATNVTAAVVGWLGRMWEGMLVAAVGVGAWVARIVESFKQDMLKVWVAMTEALTTFVRRLRAFIASIAGSLLDGLRSGPADMQPGGVPAPLGGPRASPSAFRVAPQHSTSVPIYNVIYLNTDRVAEGVTRSQSRMASRPPAGTTRVDYRSQPIWPSSMIPT